MISEVYKYFRAAYFGHLSMDWTVIQLLNPPKKPETLIQQVKREILSKCSMCDGSGQYYGRSGYEVCKCSVPTGESLSRDQSEDRMPPGGLYLVVGVDNPPGLPEGRYYYVQHPLGGRNSGYAKQASAATRWAIYQQADRDEYTPEDNDEDVYYGD